jgi:hypothetical protein
MVTWSVTLHPLRSNLLNVLLILCLLLTAKVASLASGKADRGSTSKTVDCPGKKERCSVVLCCHHLTVFCFSLCFSPLGHSLSIIFAFRQYYPPIHQKVCIRVIRAAQSLSQKDSTLSKASALQQYCQLPQLGVEDAKFCYDIDTIQKELKRLLDLGANEDRICRRVYAVNPHFCMSSGSSGTGGGKVEVSTSGETDSIAKNTQNSEIDSNNESESQTGSVHTEADSHSWSSRKASVNRAISNSKIHTAAGTTRRGIIYI